MSRQPSSAKDQQAKARQTLLTTLRREGISDPLVLRAIEEVPRDRFVDPVLRDQAWANIALAIPHGQTISQPLVVAMMSQALDLDGSERVLEIGTGSGYQAAILAKLAREVITIERIPQLAELAATRFAELDIDNIQSITGDGSVGWPAGAPYDAIIVTAGARNEPDILLSQLDQDHGRMVIPIGPVDGERLILFRYDRGASSRQDLGSVRFVPLIHDHIEEADS